jgi:hypothetical protein
MSSTGFLGQIRKASNNKTARTVKELANRYQKLYTQNVNIEDESLVDQGRNTKGRVILDNKLQYANKITAIPAFYVPVEPDNEYLTFWIKGNHTGYHLHDLSLFDNVVTTNNSKHWCLVDSGGLNVGYLGTHGGVNSCPCWQLDGLTDSGQVTDNARLRVSSSTVGISVTAWVKISDFSLHQSINRRIVAKKDDTTNGYVLFITSSNKAVFSVKFNNTEYKVETPATLQEDTWYFIAGTFNSASPAAKIYLNGTLSTTAFSSSVTYPYVNTNLQLFGNGNDGHLGDKGDFSGWARDVRIWREKVLTQQEITNFNTNRNSISNIALGSVMIAGFTWVGGDMLLSSFTTTSFSTTSFNT